MQAADVRWLDTARGREATARATALLAADLPLPTVIQRLRAPAPPDGDAPLSADEARRALQLAEARAALSERHPLAASLFADRAGAEQAAHARVAQHTAGRFAGYARVADLGCGIGVDTLAIAHHAPVLAVDRDPARLGMTERNALLAAPPHPVVTELADLDTWALPADVDGCWLDPARRDGDRRRMAPARWSPPLDRALELARSPGLRGAGVKIGPAADFAPLPTGVEVECISLGGSLRAAVVWLGEAAGPPRRATVLRERPGDGTAWRARAHTLSGDGAHGGEVRPIGRWLYDPDPAVGRSGLVRALGEQIGAWQLDARVAYLSADAPHATPFARRYRVQETLPATERRLRAALTALGAQRVEVGRRGSPTDVNALERRLNAALPGALPAGAEPTTVLLTRIGGTHTAIICTRERDNDGDGGGGGTAR